MNTFSFSVWTALSTGALAEWLADHPVMLSSVLPLVLQALGNPDLSVSSVSTLKKICRECKSDLTPYANNIVAVSQVTYIKAFVICCSYVANNDQFNFITFRLHLQTARCYRLYCCCFTKITYTLLKWFDLSSWALLLIQACFTQIEQSFCLFDFSRRCS